MQYKEIPFVIVDRAANVTLKNSVTIDNYKGAKLAVRHLYSVGCRKIIHISGPIHLVPSQERLRGYMETVKQYSLDFIHYEADFSLESGISLTKKAMAEHPDADGFFLGNDLMAIGCLKMLKYLQKRVPEEIAIAGFDGIALTTMVEPEITTVVQPISEIGIAAANKLLLLINGIQDKQESLPELNVTLAARASTLGFKGGANRKKEA